MLTSFRRKFLLILLPILCLIFIGAGMLFGMPSLSASAAGITTLEELRRTDPADIAKLHAYDGRDFGIVTPVRNQTVYNLCWAYATIAASETSILREGLGGASADTLDFEERNLAYWAHNPRTDEFHLTDDDVEEGDGSWNKGGYVEVAGKSMLQWMGPADQLKDRPNDAKDDVAEDICARYPVPYKLEAMVPVKYSVENVKLAVSRYGAVAFSFPIHTYESGYYSIDTHFCNVGQDPSNPHACAIIGWDDSIPKTQFTPVNSSMNGGWIVKNSWGTGGNDGGYFYLSYDSDIYDVWAFDYAEADAFDKQYYYNGTLLRGSGVYYPEEGGKVAAIYRAQGGTSEESEELIAFNIGVADDGVTVKAKVYSDIKPVYGEPDSPLNDPEAGTPVSSAEIFLGRRGYHTVYLDTPVPLDNRESFSIVVTAEREGGSAGIYVTLDYRSTNDMTFYTSSGEWRNLHERSCYSAHLRAYTRLIPRAERESPNDLKFASVTLGRRSYVYDGTEKLPSVTVESGGRTLREGTDYRLTYADNLEPLKNASVTVTGVGDYTGEIKEYFHIGKAEYPPNRPPFDTNCPIVVGKEVTHLGQIPLPEGWEWLYDVNYGVYYDGLLDQTSEWSIHYAGEDAAYYSRVDTGVYVRRESAEHDPVSLEGAEVEVIGSYSYTGSVVTPKVKVTLGGYLLKEGVHYTVTGLSVQAGRGVAEIEGIFTYCGKIRAEFDIAAVDPEPDPDPKPDPEPEPDPDVDPDIKEETDPDVDPDIKEETVPDPDPEPDFELGHDPDNEKEPHPDQDADSDVRREEGGCAGTVGVGGCTAAVVLAAALLLLLPKFRRKDD